RPTLLEVQEGETLVASDRLVRQEADHHLTQLLAFLDDVEMAGVDEIGAHTDIDQLRHCSSTRLGTTKTDRPSWRIATRATSPQLPHHERGKARAITTLNTPPARTPPGSSSPGSPDPV